MSFSKEQTINVRSFTVVELIGINNTVLDIMWGKYFIEAQGYTLTSSILYQDNKPCILLVANGRMPSLRRTKHIKDRYFLVKG